MNLPWSTTTHTTCNSHNQPRLTSNSSPKLGNENSELGLQTRDILSSPHNFQSPISFSSSPKAGTSAYRTRERADRVASQGSRGSQRTAEEEVIGGLPGAERWPERGSTAFRRSLRREDRREREKVGDPVGELVFVFSVVLTL